jgi:hypothetical protein
VLRKAPPTRLHYEVCPLQSIGVLENADAIMSRQLSKNKRDVIEFSIVLRGFEPAATKVVYYRARWIKRVIVLESTIIC